MSKEFMNKCYQCKYRVDIAGDCHSRCIHPVTKLQTEENLLGDLLSVFATRIGAGIVPAAAAKELDIKADQHGVKSGWFTWPYNFDPVWLRNCKGFTAKEEIPCPTTKA